MLWEYLITAFSFQVPYCVHVQDFKQTYKKYLSLNTSFTHILYVCVWPNVYFLNPSAENVEEKLSL